MISGYKLRDDIARIAAGRARRDSLAEHMANGGNFYTFAAREGTTADNVRTGPWRAIVRELGWQAR